MTCGIGLLENDTAGLSTATGEENRLQFLHGVDNIPVVIWKDIAFGYRDTVPEVFLYNGTVTKNQNYNLEDHLLLLSNEVAIAKIVELIRTPSMQPIDKFISFMNCIPFIWILQKASWYMLQWYLQVFQMYPHLKKFSQNLLMRYKKVSKIKHGILHISQLGAYCIITRIKDPVICLQQMILRRK